MDLINSNVYFAVEIVDYTRLKYWLNKLRLRQNDHFADYIFKLIFLNKNCCIFIQISLRIQSIKNDYALCNGFASNMQQPIIWTNDGLV